MSKETQIEREQFIATRLESYEEQLADALDEMLFTEDELGQLRESQIEALVGQYTEHLDEQGNEELFGNDPWQKMRDAEIEQKIKAERIRLESLTDRQLLAALPVAPLVKPRMVYIRAIPKHIPKGFVLAHNHVRQAHPIGMNGFRAFFVPVEYSGRFEVRRCKWSGLKHYRTKRS